MNLNARLPYHKILLIGILTYIFIYPFAASIDVFRVFGPLLYTVILLSIIFIIDKLNTRKAKSMMILVILSLVFVWLGFFRHRNLVSLVSFVFNIAVFGLATATMIAQIIRSAKVDAKVILESVNGYLLLGFMLILANVFIEAIGPNAFNLTDISQTDLLYLSFISLLTIGYGDIYPVSDAAKFISIFVGLAGQLYLTIIVAILIGKYLNFKNQNEIQ